MATVIRGTRLEEGFAETEDVVFADAHAGILNRDRNFVTAADRADGNAAAARRKFNGVGNKIDQDLIDRALIGHDFRHRPGHTGLERYARLMRLESQEIAATFDRL